MRINRGANRGSVSTCSMTVIDIAILQLALIDRVSVSGTPRTV
jgi:hypothetical protein